MWRGGSKMRIVYMSVVGNTRQFVKKLGLPSFELDESTVYTEIKEPYVMIAPTYGIEITELLNDFIETGDNVSYCKGVIGGGNLNFNELYCYTADDLSLDYGMPVLHRFEFTGSDKDVEKVLNICKELDNKVQLATNNK